MGVFLKQEFVRVDIVHVHSKLCGHPQVKHGDHVDYLVDGLLHFPHLNHCDNHGPLQIVHDLDE